jgi:hypothetical protein
METAVAYLDSESVEETEQTPPSVVLPISGVIVPPPEGEERELAIGELEAAVEDSGLDLEQYRTEAIVIYPGPNAEEALFSAAPINQGFDQFPDGQPVMVWYDRQNTFGYGQIAYQVSFFEGTVELFNPTNEVLISRDVSYAEQDESLEDTWAFFVEGSCRLCGCCDGVCGCLICW